MQIRRNIKRKSPNYLPTYIEAQHLHAELRRRAGTLSLPPSYDIVEITMLDEHIPKWMLIDVPYEEERRRGEDERVIFGADDEEEGLIGGGARPEVRTFKGEEEEWFVVEVGGGEASGPGSTARGSFSSQSRVVVVKSKRHRAHTVARTELLSHPSSSSSSPPQMTQIGAGIATLHIANGSTTTVALDSNSNIISPPSSPSSPCSTSHQETTLLRSVLQVLNQDRQIHRQRSRSEVLPPTSTSTPTLTRLYPSPSSSSSPSTSSPLRPSITFQLPPTACVNENKAPFVTPERGRIRTLSMGGGTRAVRGMSMVDRGRAMVGAGSKGRSRGMSAG
ncbi:hypothetical protein HK097_002012 [Rhizophlyctis rosea]|uniref:Uncharacterized protein n=1 Tax=Rhizophlyctis rosea TaxID=64517 RepID=A0AAD5SBQ2_9FUNG|nr:hypothetical protein HK097_002012 [Rhizophlyctis rosea]